MKKYITSFFLFSALALSAQENLVTNGTFQTTPAENTITTTKGVELVRISKERNTTTEITQPTLSVAREVIDHRWYRCSNASGYTRCLLSEESDSDNSYLKVYITYNSTSSEITALQRIGKIDPSKQYEISFKARKDNNSDTKAGHINQLSDLSVGLIDLETDINTEQGVYSNDTKRNETVMVTPNWENYTVTIDVPAWKEKIKSKFDLTGNSIGIYFYVKALTEVNAGTGKYLWYGVDLDNVELKEKITSGISKVTKGAPSVTLAEGGIFVETQEDQNVSVFAVTGQSVCQKAVRQQERTFIPLHSGIYFIKAGAHTQKVILK